MTAIAPRAIPTRMHALHFYAQAGRTTRPGLYAGRLDALPDSIPALVRSVQGLLLPAIWADRVGLSISKERRAETELRALPQMLARIVAMNPAPLDQTRPLNQRLVGYGRHYATLLTGFLRQQGIPARARCGFVDYLAPDQFQDHWLCEYWHSTDDRWLLVDPHLDAHQCEALHLDFDPQDIPRHHFQTGGDTWLACRQDKANPDQFGLSAMHGLWYIRGNLLRDFVALNKLELLTWDAWGIAARREGDLRNTHRALLDYVALLVRQPDKHLPEIRYLYATNPHLACPDGWLHEHGIPA